MLPGDSFIDIRAHVYVDLEETTIDQVLFVKKTLFVVSSKVHHNTGLGVLLYKCMCPEILM